MRFTRAIVAALLLAALVPTSAQDGLQPYFSLSSNRTYAPGDKPQIQMWSQNVEALEFRVYRVNDPVAFYRNLEDAHGMRGGRRGRPEPQVTWIERIHVFKQRVRRQVSDAFRAQYTPDSRAAIRDWLASRRRAPVSRVSSYADLPLLNPQQVVAVWRQNISRRNRWESETIPVDVKEKGLYLVEAAHGELRAYTVVVVTGLAVVSKTSAGRILAFAVNNRTGAPVPDCPLVVLADRQELARARTGADGLADIPLAGAASERTLVLARRGDDFAVDALYAWHLADDPDRMSTGYVYTDRPIYRPGHTLYWKAILRQQTGAGYQIPSRKEVRVEITDPEGKTVFRKEAVGVSAMGTAHGEFAVPQNAALGYYSIQIYSGEFQATAGFHVEEYKKPEYEVRVTAAQSRVVQGSPIQATISARYFFGEPVARAKVTWVVHRARYWSPLFEPDEEVGGEEGDQMYGGDSEQISEQSGELDADGRLAITVPTDPGNVRWDMRYRIEARVTDASNREINGYGFVLATRGSFLVNLAPRQYVYSPGERAGFNVEARDYEGKPVQTAVRVELWQSRDGSDKQQIEARTDVGGVAKVEFTLPQNAGGSYSARAVATTPENREVEDGAWIWVSGSGAWWQDARRERLQIVLDKKSYRPGDVAKALIVTGVPDARVLLTIEGQQLHERRIVTASQAAITVEVPVKAEFAPNVYISAAFVRDNQLHEGTKMLKVPAVDKQLQVKVEPSKSEFKPGEPAVYTVTARDHAGKPVVAEFSLGVVDEAIYAIRPDPTQDIFKFFYGMASNRIGTHSSLNYYFHGEAGKRRMQLTEWRNRRALAQLKPEQLVQPRVRKAFPDTAIWLANLVTDATGRGQARFTFPDALTTWRATARGVTRDTQVGAALDKTIVRKNLMLRLSTPRFFTEGDEVTVSVLVHNYLKTEKTARVSLDVEGLEVLDGATRDLTIASSGEGRADWRVRARSVRQAKLTGKALTDEESDAMELTLPINPYGVKLAEARAGSIPGGPGDADFEIAFPANIVPGSRTLEIGVTPSIAGAIFGALEYLTTFPYGCTEQTMSSFLPNILVSKALRELKVPSKIDPAELEKKIKAGLDRLYSFQHEDGGWGWWESDESHAFMSAYVVAGLAQARGAGHAVRDDVVERGAKWLRAHAEQNKKLAADLRVYMIYAMTLAGIKERALLDAGMAQRGALTPYGIALLGLALDQAGDARAGEMVAQLESLAKSDERDAYWQVDQDHLMDLGSATSAEATAHALKLLARLRPASPLLEKAALWLASHRDQGEYWQSTKQTAMVVYGLIDYLKASGELRPNYSVTVSVNGKQVLSRRFTESDALSPESPAITLRAEDLAAAGNQVRIRKTGTGRLYWSTRAEFYSAEDQLRRSGSVGLELARDYFKLVPVKEGERIVHQLEPLQGALNSGDVLAVRLTLNGGSWRYLIIEDPIPAGAEFIEKDDFYQLKDRPPWWQYSYARREFHDDRAAIFQTYFYKDTSRHFYLLKVVNPGRFRVSPARVQPMYQPQYLSTTESRVVEVK